MEKTFEAPERFHERGIRLVLGEGQHEERIWKFFLDVFIADEPVFRLELEQVTK